MKERVVNMQRKTENDLHCSLRAILKYEEVPFLQRNALTLYMKGLSNKNAAGMLGVSEASYAWCLRSIRKKFKLKTKEELGVLQTVLNGQN